MAKRAVDYITSPERPWTIKQSRSNPSEELWPMEAIVVALVVKLRRLDRIALLCALNAAYRRLASRCINQSATNNCTRALIVRKATAFA